MVELKFLKLKMYAVAFDVEKILRRTQVLETRVPPYFFQTNSLSSSSSSSSPVFSVYLKPFDVPLFCC